MIEQTTKKVIELEFVCHDGMHYNSIDVTLKNHSTGDEEKDYYTIFASAYATGMDDKELQESVVGYGHSIAKALQRLERDTVNQLEHCDTNKLDSKMFYLRVLQWIYTGE